MKPEWILIASATQARLLSRETARDPLVPVAHRAHPQGRMRSTELTHDQSGRNQSDQRPGATAYTPHTDPRHREHERFARELAQMLAQGVAAGACRSVTVFACSPFLGELKNHLDSATSRMLTAAIDLDLTRYGLSELEQRIADALKAAR